MSVLVLVLSLVLGQVLRSTRAASQVRLGLHGDVSQSCAITCPLQNKTEADFYVGCGNDCKIEQCSRGCMSWQIALGSSCQSVCNGTQNLLPPKQLYCIMGCNDALNRYFQILKAELGRLPAPALVADTLTATSLRLEWEDPQHLNASRLVQWRPEEGSPAWHYCRNQTWGPSGTVLIENLTPYTKYRFRIALLLSPHHSDPVVSEPSVVISTQASGTPSSPPNIVRATAVDSSRISVSWEPGPFPNGPVLSYVLQISELPGGYSALKDIPASEQTESYMFTNVEARKNYSISVAMRNAVGQGPAATVTVSTSAEPIVFNNNVQPVLILGAHNVVIRRAADMIDEPVVIYNTSCLIKGVAIHISKKLLFVSDSEGYVLRTSLRRYQAPITILTSDHTNFMPLDLSVDWLNDQLYMLGQVSHSSGPRWQIARCSLHGRGLTVAVAGFLSKPHHIEVDPYNGYLFWVIRGISKSGLYRLDLADISNGVKHDILPDLILEDPFLGAFTVDHTNFQLLVANHTQNTIMSVRLDGHEVVDFRNNTQQPMFHDVLSLATANGLFYWTNGEEVRAEEYHKEQRNYFHYAFADLDRKYVSVSVDLPKYVSVSVDLPITQPIPIPVNPPTNVQAVLGADIAKTSWQAPHLLGGQGKGAWQNWSYELHIEDELRNKTIFKQGINSSSCTIQNLIENTKYIIKTAAYTSAGKGPWSSEFKGKTLRIPSDGKYASILWSASEGLLKSDVTGENVETLIHKSNLKANNNDYHIIDIAWYKDNLYLVTNTTHVYWYNLKNHGRGQLKEIDSVGSIAVDWIGKKLYWSNPKQQLITRGNLDGGQQEPLPILTVAKELNIDAIKGHIYWSTGHAVECARLNGESRYTYYPAELFSGKQVMGLTLDMDQHSVYWIVRSYEGSKLFQAPMADDITIGTPAPIKISNLQHPNMQGPLCYFSDHLLWLQDDRNAVIGDMNGQNAAVISGMSLSGLHMVAILDPALHQLPNTTEEVNVIPESVNADSIKITGTWKSFTIQWKPVSNVNYGKVYYEVKIDDFSKKEITKVVSEPFVIYRNPEELMPYSKLKVLINSFTYWGKSPQVRAMLHSPPYIPSVPTNPRVFVSYVRNPVKGNQDIMAVFRWDPPDNPNGIIEGYNVSCWLTYNNIKSHHCDSVFMDSSKLEFAAYNLLKNSTYYFQVEAYTQVGTGEHTVPVRADTDVEMPVPKLLLSTIDAVKITDCDKQENQTLSRSSGPPVDVAFMSLENKVFWLNDMQELYCSRTDCKHRNKILTLNCTGLSIAVDWIARYIYWAEKDDRGSGSYIYSLDLNQVEKGNIHTRRILRRPKTIQKLEVSPFQSSLFWIEVNRNDVGYLMTSKVDGTMIQPFFTTNRNRRRRQSFFIDYCSCPENPTVGKAMTIDQTDLTNPKIFWVDGMQHHIFSTDTDGCHCSLIINATENIEAGLPPTSLTTDHKLVYWSNATEGRVYSAVKNTDEVLIGPIFKGVKGVNINGVQQIAALGTHLQPYPVPRCLMPKQLLAKVKMLNCTDTAIRLELPKPERYPECENISLATIEYTLHYKLARDGLTNCGNNHSLCSHLVTFNKIITVSNLKPFSKYLFIVEMRNYYSELEGVSSINGSAVELRTAPGAPSPPQNVTVTIRNPTSVKVQWLPPKEFNDFEVWYEIHWKTEGMVAGVRPKGEQAVQGNGLELPKEIQTADLLTLMPGQRYIIWVRAYSQSTKAYSESDAVEVTTYDEPKNFTLIQNTPYSLNISWTPNSSITRSEILCYEFGSRMLVKSILPVAVEDNHTYLVENLKPKTQYTFELSLYYPSSEDPYIWPSDGRFTYETLGDRPGPPGAPVVHNLRRDVYQVMWESSAENGAQLELYSLEGRNVGNRLSRREANSTFDLEDSLFEGWTSHYNGTESYWIISDLSPSYKHIFRVRSKNKYGWSEFSESSEPFDFTEAEMLPEQQELGVVLGISIPILVAVVFAIGMLIFVYVFRRREKEKKALQTITLANTNRRLDVELATLRELPRRGNFIHNTNALYTLGDVPTDEEMALLPHIRRDQITLTKFLGSGAFGEVFEGNARNLVHSGDVVTRVAIKTLRKGATEDEKAEFLKEAQLMSNFKHEHILQLLGVCLDNDPNFIIMELMESGDLLSYLRSSRPNIYSSNALTLLDLISMCVDVAKGCRYLEEMHFVHRDLACRNCLVSSGDPQTRVVKIGDFGLARDIYKNDYYRKEGEGLLPVRWMAPESLVDGVFTCQSDVWAFGVLIWEIMTFGQQPYPARTNLEVLHYVRNGGRLGRPNNCPDELHQLMQKTWSYNCEGRPTFKYCLEILEDLKNKLRDAPSTVILNGHYLTQMPNGCSWKTTSDEDSRDQVPFLQSDSEGLIRQNESSNVGSEVNSREVPRYLELIYDTDVTAAVGDGYEIPRILPAPNAQIKACDAVSSSERLRTFSTSSTISDGSASTSLSYQHVPLVNNQFGDRKLTESASCSEMSSNECVSEKNLSDLKTNGDKELNTIENIIAPIKLLNNILTNSRVASNTDISKSFHNNVKHLTSYTNVTKQPLLEETHEFGNNNLMNICNEVVNSPIKEKLKVNEKSLPTNFTSNSPLA